MTAPISADLRQHVLGHATKAGSLYLPSLEPLLKGDTLLLSWQEAYSSVALHILRHRNQSGRTAAPDSHLGDEHSLLSFLVDPESLQHLAAPFEPFSPPSADSTSNFDRLTSAINVTPDGGRYDVNQIKNDASWLSDRAKINKTAALRIVVLEWQQRSRARLLWVGGDEAEAFGQQNQVFQKSSFFAKSTMISDSQLGERSNDEFVSNQARQDRLLRLYLGERLAILRTSSLLIRHSLRYVDATARSPSKLAIIGHRLSLIICEKGSGPLFTGESARVENCIEDFTAALQQRVNRLESGSGWNTRESDDGALEQNWVQLQLDEMVPILQLLFSIASRVKPSSKATLAYFQLWRQRNFFDFNPDQHQDSVVIVKILANLAAAAFFHTGYSLDTLKTLTSAAEAPNLAFAADVAAMQELSDIMATASLGDVPVAGLPVYSWVIFLSRWKSMFATPLTDDYDFLTASKLESLASRSLVALKVLQIIADAAGLLRLLWRNSPDASFQDEASLFLLRLLSYSVDSSILIYNEEVISTLLAVLDADQPYSVPSEQRLFASTRPGLVMSYVRPFLEHAFSRFPLETAPVVRIMRALLLVNFEDRQEYLDCLDILHKSNEYTDTLNLEFTSYETVDDAYASDRFLIRLRAELPVFLSKPGMQNQTNSSSFGESHWEISSCVDAQTIGEVRHHEPRPLIVTWEFDFSPISYLVDCLATTVPLSRHTIYSAQEPLPMEETTDIVRLASTVLLVLAQNDPPDALTHAHDLLNHRFSDLDDEKDLITLVYELFESQLQEKQVTDTSVELLTVCVDFFHAASHFTANRVWSILARSQLLGVNGSDPALITIVTNHEMVNGTYGLLSSSLRLFAAMVNHAFVIPQSNATSTRKSLSRLGKQTNNAFPVLSKTSRTVVTAFTRILVSVFENCQFWRFDRLDEQSDIMVALMSTFEKILTSGYGYDPENALASKITHPLLDAVSELTDRFLSTNYNTSLTLPLVNAISRAIPSPTLTSEPQMRSSIREIQSALNLAMTVLHIGTFLKKPQSALESHLFRVVPILARLFAAVPQLTAPLSSLFQVLLLTVPESGSSAPSLLVHMGAGTAKSFLVLLTQANKPLQDTERDLALWRLMTSVASSRQQWFAFYLLTGRTPRETPKSQKEGAEANGCQSQPVFEYALDQIPLLLARPAEQLLIPIHMLRFIAYSYNNWPWAVSKLRQHPKFLGSITNYFGSLRTDEGPATMATVMQALVASEIAEILSMNLHTSRQISDLQPAIELIQKLGFFKAIGFKPPFLNTNMQRRLSSNVDDLYPGLKTYMFQHSQVFPTEYGNDFFYNVQTGLTLMEAVSNAGRSTTGKAKVPNHSALVDDVKRANVDMSRMQAQLVLHGKCELLAAELAQISRLDDRFELVDTLMDIVQACLASVREGTSELSAAILDKLELSRVDLVLLVFQRLATIRDPKTILSLRKFFGMIWKDLRSLVVNSESTYAGKTIAMNRQLLRILFLALQPLAHWTPPGDAGQNRGEYRTPPAVEYSAQLMDILSEVVSKGFKSLASLVHSFQDSVEPSDFAIVTAILQTILKIPGADNIHQQLALNLANSEVTKFAASLFSWSDQLLIEGDPVYGEHSVLFLLELSSIPEMAETLAVEGVLARLSSASLMALYTRKRGMGPFDKPVRLHSIWSKGILPLCLNLLDAVGAPIVPEVVSFLAQYPAQLERINRELSNRRNPIGPRPGDSYLTMNMASEVHSLALIWRIVEHHRVLGAASGSLGGEIPPLPWDKNPAKEEIDDWLQARGSVRERLLAANERDAELLALRGKDGKSESRLEERVWAELVGASECLGGREA